jgi:hypothetical protein
VRDHNGQQLAYAYFEDEPGSRSAAKLLSDQYRQAAAAGTSLKVLFFGLKFFLTGFDTRDHAPWRVTGHIPAIATISATPLRATTAALRKSGKRPNRKANRSSR